MRIAYLLTCADQVGGASIHVVSLAEALQDEGQRPIVLVGGHGPFTDLLQGKGIPFHSLPNLTRTISPLKDALAVKVIVDQLRELKPDLLSTHNSKAGVLGRVAGRLTQIPTLFTAHGWAFSEGVGRKRWVYRQIERRVAPLTAAIVTVSEYDRGLALEAGIGPPDRIVCIHNGMPDVEPNCRGDPSREPPRLIMVARFAPQKDHETLLKALNGLRDRPWTLDLIGDGPTRQKIEAKVVSLGLADRVRILGYVDDVDRRLSEAQAFILTSHWEGLPRSIIEAMRAGLPVVASNIAGIPEQVVDGVTGYLVPRGDDRMLRNRLENILQNPSLRGQLGAAGRRRYEHLFTFERMFDETTCTYNRVLRTSTRL